MAKIIPTGPFHPILEEPEFFQFHVEGEIIQKIDMQIGWSHRGIELLSEEGRGSKFTVRLPMDLGPDSASKTTEE